MHPEIPWPGRSEGCRWEAWLCLCPSLLAASGTGAEQQQDKSGHRISCNPVMNTMLAAVLIRSLHIEENSSLSLPLPRQVLNGTNPLAKLASSALSYRGAALRGPAVRSPPGLCRPPPPLTILSPMSLKANATITRI